MARMGDPCVTATRKVLPKLRLRITGAFPHGERYPHTSGMLRACRSSPELVVSGHYGADREDRSLFELSRSSAASRLGWVIRYGLKSCSEAIAGCLCWSRRQIDAVLIPYPAIGTLLVLSLIPEKVRPPVVADIFISLADTVVGDRRLIPERSMLARFIWALEARAIRTADVAVFDTCENASWAQGRMGLVPTRLQSAPLFIDERVFGRSPYTPTSGKTKVLFVGTFVPLHGTAVVAEAIGWLRHREDIEFHIVGDGQSAQDFARAIEGCARVRWDRGWRPGSEIAELIRDADICLGIFGDTPKAGRVWPLKNYCYMAVGRALITSRAHGLPHGIPAVDGVEFVEAGNGGGRALADAIAKLAADPALRKRMARRAAAYYDEYLSNDACSRYLMQSIRKAVSQRAKDLEIP